MSLKRNTGYNLAGALVPLVTMFVTLPFYLRVIGEERYGVLAILWMLFGYFGLFDLGLGRAVTNGIAALRLQPAIERERVFWTALVTNLVLGVLGAGALYVAAAVVLERFVGLPGSLVDEVHAALPFMVIGFPFVLTNSVLSGALMGREEFFADNGVRASEGIMIQIIPLMAAVWIGPEVPILVASLIVVRLGHSGILFLLCLIRLPAGLRPRFDRGRIRPLISFGGWVTVTSVIGPLLSTLDRVIIGAVAGIRAVTYYTVPFGLVSRLTIIPGSLSNAIFPRFSSEIDPAARHYLLRRAMAALVVLITPLVLASMLAMAPFLEWWVDAEFSMRAATVGEVLLAGIWFNCLAYLPYSMLQGGGRPDLVAKIHTAEVVPYLIVLWLALDEFGVVGAAAVWSVRVAIDAALLFAAGRVGRDVARSLMVPGTMLFIALLIVSLLPWHSPSRWILGFTVLAAALGWAWRNKPEELTGLRTPRFSRRRTTEAVDPRT